MMQRYRTGRRRLAVACCFLSCLLATASAAQDLQNREYKIPTVGVLHLRVPAQWQEVVEWHGKTPPVNIAYTATKHDFEYYVSVVWDGPRRDLEGVRRFVKRRSEGLLSQIVETEIPIREAIGEHASGYYFTVTDRNSMPAAGDFKFMTKGLVRLDTLEVTFTLLPHDKNSTAIEDALVVVRTAKFANK